MLKIGNLKLSLPFILAPMSGISDLPFRLLNRKFGCELAFTEMIDVRSFVYKNEKTIKMLSTEKNDKPLGIQILGSEPDFILKALEALQEYKFDILDFNAACPVKKVTSRDKGASLLKNPKKLFSLLKLIVNNSSVPVTIKIRSGWDKKNINAKEIALAAEDAGVKGLFIHGRTRTQGYTGNTDYTIIKEVKKVLKIPVIGSGDIFSAELAKKMLEETGCDAVSIARGALGNPWIFQEMTAFFKHRRPFKKPNIAEITKIMAKHLKLCIDFHGQRIGLVLFRKFFNWYTKGMGEVRPLREKACHAKTEQEMLAIIKKVRLPTKLASSQLRTSLR